MCNVFSLLVDSDLVDLLTKHDDLVPTLVTGVEMFKSDPKIVLILLQAIEKLFEACSVYS